MPPSQSNSPPRRVWLFHCALGDDLIQGRCHLDVRCFGPPGCNAAHHYCGCKPKLYVLSRAKEQT